MIILKIGHFGGLGGSKTTQKGGGFRPPQIWMVLKPPGAAQTSKTTDFQPNPKPPLLEKIATNGSLNKALR